MRHGFALTALGAQVRWLQRRFTLALLAFSVLAVCPAWSEQPIKVKDERADQRDLRSAPIEAPTPVFIDPLQTRKPREIPGFEVLDGFRVGGVTLFPTYNTKLVYDDNVFGRTKAQDPVPDLIYSNSPGMRMRYRPKHDLEVNVGYEFGWHDYLDDVARDYYSQSASGGFTWKNFFYKDFTIGVNNSYSQTAHTEVFDDEFSSFTRTQGNNLTVMTSYQRKRLGFNAAYTFGLTDYFGKSSTQGDYHTHNALAQVYYKVTDRLITTLDYTYEAYRLAHAHSGHFDTHSIMGSATTSLGKFKLSLAAGNKRAIALDPYDSNDGLAVEFGLNYQANRRIKLGIRGRRAFNTGILTGAAYITEFSGEIGYVIAKRVRLDGSYVWSRSDRFSGLLQDTAQFDARLTGQIAKRWTGHLNYTRIDRTTSASPDVSVNRVDISIQMRF